MAASKPPNRQFSKEQAKYDLLKDLAPVSMIMTGPLVLVTRTDFPANDLKEFVASYSGLSREVVNKTIRDFESRGLVRRDVDGIHVADYLQPPICTSPASSPIEPRGPASRNALR